MTLYGPEVCIIKNEGCCKDDDLDLDRRLRFSSDADNVRLTNVCIIIIIISKMLRGYYVSR